MDNCNSLIPSICDLSTQVLWALRITYSCLALLSIIGNSLLICALKKTGQLTNLSLELIILMSTSDCINGITALFLTNILLWKEYDSLCHLKALTQFISNLFGSFSFTTVLLIAIDRYLHIKYLQRYPIIVTKRKGRSLLLLLFILQILIALVYSMPFLKTYRSIGKCAYTYGAIIIIIAVIVLYYKTIKTINRRVLSMHTPIMQNTLTHSKRIMNAALRISICTVLILTPYVIANILSEASIRYEGNISKKLIIFMWFTYLGSLANGICSCVIFVLQSRPIKRWLIGIIVH